jgi:hypothetical protein
LWLTSKVKRNSARWLSVEPNGKKGNLHLQQCNQFQVEQFFKK